MKMNEHKTIQMSFDQVFTQSERGQFLVAYIRHTKINTYQFIFFICRLQGKISE